MTNYYNSQRGYFLRLHHSPGKSNPYDATMRQCKRLPGEESCHNSVDFRTLRSSKLGLNSTSIGVMIATTTQNTIISSCFVKRAHYSTYCWILCHRGRNYRCGGGIE
mmetsp:Transcript_46418/g.47118  ORF Transcript_46418/g.47118 Transcript_46418/m.47118 type:complete len:107 (+) Transcript_46418:102-422(+)